jgi:hypothetical protein
VESIDGRYRLNLDLHTNKRMNEAFQTKIPPNSLLQPRTLGICPDCNGEAALETYYEAQSDRTYQITRCLKATTSHIVSKKDIEDKQNPRVKWNLRTGVTCKPRKEIVCDGRQP